MADFPTVLTAAQDNVTDVLAKLVNNLENKVGINNSAVTNSIDYLMKAAPEGFLINGKIVPSVAANDLTVALKGMDGNDPSATNPVYVKINGVVRSITAALATTDLDGTNWRNAGSAELATKEIDYFVYLGWNAADANAIIFFSRIPYGTVFSDCSGTNTAESAHGTVGGVITNIVNGDAVTVIGRFAATLSAGAGYTWTVPTFTVKNLIQRPIYETRKLEWTPTWALDAGTLTTTYSSQVGRYSVQGSILNFEFYMRLNTVSAATATKMITCTVPFTGIVNLASTQPIGTGRFYDDSGGLQAWGGLWYNGTVLYLGGEFTDWGATSVGISPNITLATADRFGGTVSIRLI